MKRALALCLVAGCAAQLDAPTVDAVPGRQDVTVLSYRAHVKGGLSEPVTIDLPAGVDAALVEIAGDSGEFRLAQLTTPSGRDVVESGGFVTRDAREVDGLVDWLYPNSPALAARVATLYAQAGVAVADYTAATLHLGGSSELPLDGGKLTLPSLQALQAAVRAAGARPEALHLVVVRALDDGNGPVAGYALGLPGPFAAARPTAAVLVSAAPFASPSTGVLDTEAMGVTCAHEIGHYLGLYHTSERDGGQHDPIGDTPECAGTSACPDASNVMFWTGGGARSKLTAGQGAVMRLHPLVAAAAAPVVPAADCADACNAGDSCVVLAGQSVCATACDPQNLPCTSGRCAPSDDGTFVCRAD
ncbi:MAG: hypothetical protein ACXVDD_26540 [Polyangia bacterium]